MRHSFTGSQALTRLIMIYSGTPSHSGRLTIRSLRPKLQITSPRSSGIVPMRVVMLEVPTGPDLDHHRYARYSFLDLQPAWLAYSLLVILL